VADQDNDQQQGDSRWNVTYVAPARASRPPSVRSVRSVRNLGGSNTSNSEHTPPTPLLTSASNTSNSSNTPGSDTPNTLLATVRNGRWLSETTFPPLQYAVPEILPAGFTLLAGPPKAGKSWLVLNWLLAVSAGGRALGQIPVGEARQVLYFALEDSDRRMQQRCRTVLEAADIPERFAYETHAQPHLVVPMIQEFLEQRPSTRLIVLDTLGKVMPPMHTGETTYQRDYRVGGMLQAITVDHPGLSIVAAHHTRKSISADFVDSVSGTNGLAGAADTIIVLSRERNSAEGVLSVTGRDVEEAEYALTSDRGQWVIDGSDLGEAANAAHERKDTINLSGRSRDILDFVSARPEGMAAKEVTEKFGASAYTYLRRLEADGHLDSPTRGYYCAPLKAAS
jgi:hypothetical protein